MNESYSLNTGNTAPRGAASTIAGDKTWVVDANRKVYVYNNSGGLLGSWTAGTLASNATVEGIATNGTDVWIVDAKSDKVFKYAGAATRISGSQTAASSFSLNSGNTSPKDIVTDGTSLWVVNDTTTDKVFKYTVSGSLVRQLDHQRRRRRAPPASRSIPANVSNLWIVDSGDRSRVSVQRCGQRDLRLVSAVGQLRPGRRQHQPARHRRSARAGQPADDRDAGSLRRLSPPKQTRVVPTLPSRTCTTSL